MARLKLVVITVAGTSNFPLDMLRYDCCFPQGSEDVSQMVYSEDHHLRTDAIKNKVPFKVTLVCAHEHFTPGRWASFGWSVIRCVVDHRALPQPKWPSR